MQFKVKLTFCTTYLYCDPSLALGRSMVNGKLHTCMVVLHEWYIFLVFYFCIIFFSWFVSVQNNYTDICSITIIYFSPGLFQYKITILTFAALQLTTHTYI